MDKKVLLIGGSGFIGRHLAKKLLDLGWEIVVIDKIEATGANPPLGGLAPVDADNKEAMQEIFDREKPDIVFHLAGAINLRKGIDDPGLNRAKIVCDCCRKNNVKKIIFFSSGSAIQDNPESRYGLANMEIEKIIQQSGLDYVILRLANVYGPGQWEQGIIPQILTNKNLKIKSNGEQTRDFIYVDDVAEAAVLARDKKGVYNIGSGRTRRLNEVIEIIKKYKNVSFKYNHEQDFSARALDIEKTRKDFNWEPKTNLEQGLIKTIKYFEEETLWSAQK